MTTSATSDVSGRAGGADSELPPEGTRTLLSFLLFLHLLALSTAAIGARPISPLRNHLSDIPGVRDYLSLLGMNLSYSFHLTYGLEEDTPHFLAIEVPADESTSATTEKVAAQPGGDRLIFPEPDLLPGIRAGRYRNLLLRAYHQAIDEDRQGYLPRAIAARVLAEQGIEDSGRHRVRLQRRNLLPPENVRSGNPSDHDVLASRLVQTLYEADVWRSREGWEIVEVSSKLTSAAVRGDAAAPDGAAAPAKNTGLRKGSPSGKSPPIRPRP